MELVMAGKPSALLLLAFALIIFKGSVAEKSYFECTQDAAEATKCIGEAGNIVGEQTKKDKCAIYNCIEPLKKECPKTFDFMYSNGIRGDFDPLVCWFIPSGSTETRAVTLTITLGIVLASVGVSWLFR